MSYSSSTKRAFRQAPHYTIGNYAKDMIVLHWWDLPSKRPQFDGVVSWFLDARSGVSIHYMVEANRVLQMVKEKDMAYHAGHLPTNRRSIGIEINPRLSDGDYQTAAEVIADIWKRRGKLPLRRHGEFTGTQCPGTLDVGRLQRLAEALYSGKATATPVSAPKPSVPKPAPAKAKPAPKPAPTSYANKTGWPQRSIRQPINNQLWEKNAYEGTKFALVEALRRAGCPPSSVTEWGRLVQLSDWLRRRHGLRGPDTRVEMWKRVQTFLKGVNRYSGAIDGIPGSNTTRGLIGWLNDIRPAYL